MKKKTKNQLYDDDKALTATLAKATSQKQN